MIKFKYNLNPFLFKICQSLQISKKALCLISFIALVFAIFVFPVWYQIFTYHNLPVQIEMSAPGSEYVRIYWDNPDQYPEAYERVTVNPVSFQTWHIKIETLENKNPKSQGSSVWISDISTPQGQVNWNEIVMGKIKWDFSPFVNAPQGKAAIAQKGQIQVMETSIEGGKLTISFLRNPWAGKAKITVNNQVREVDLFSELDSTEKLIFQPTHLGDELVRNYQIRAVDTPWHRLRFIAEGGGQVRVRDIRAQGQLITERSENRDFTLSFKFWNRLSCAIFATAISFFWMIVLFASTLHIWRGEINKRFGNWSYILGLSIALGGFWMLVFYPAIMTIDSINQWKQALDNQYHTWYPPITAILMHLSQFLSDSPNLYCFIQGSLFWVSILCLLRVVVSHNQLFVLGSCFLIALPSLWIYPATLVTNVGTATFALLASAFMIQAVREQSYCKFWISVVLLSVAVCFRHDAIFLVLIPLIIGQILLFPKRIFSIRFMQILMIIIIVILPSKIIEKLPNVESGTPVGFAFINQYVGTAHYSQPFMSQAEFDTQRQAIDTQFGGGTFDKLLERYRCDAANYIVEWAGPKYTIINTTKIQANTSFIIAKTLGLAIRHPIGYLKHKICNVSYMLQIPQMSYFYAIPADMASITKELNQVGIEVNSRIPVVRDWTINTLGKLLQNDISLLLFRHYLFLLISLTILVFSIVVKRIDLLVISLFSILAIVGFLIADTFPDWRYLLLSYICSWIGIIGVLNYVLTSAKFNKSASLTKKT